MEKMEQEQEWKKHINKTLKVIYDDGGQYPSKKTGVLDGYTSTHLFLKISSHIEAILLLKILRIEILGGMNNE
jgi:hypothetical protein